MTSVADRHRISSALVKLSLKPWGDDSPIYDHLMDFGDAIEYLSMFVDCIRNWSDALVLAPHLGSLAARIEASVEKLGGEFIEEVKRDKRASVLRAVSFNLFGGYEERGWKWRYFFEKSKAMIDVLKPEIAEACDGVWIVNSVKYRSPFLGLYEWTKFHVHQVKGKFVPLPHWRRPSIRLEEPTCIHVILDFLAHDNGKNPKMEAFLVKVGSSIVSAGLLSFQWWAKNFDPNVKEDVDAAFRNVAQKIGLTNPDFIDIILGEMNGPGKSSSIAETIVNRLIPYVGPYQELGGKIFRLL